MQNIRVQFTVPNVERVVNLDVKVNGEHRAMQFRVEAFDWEDGNHSTEYLVTQLRNRIDSYDTAWKLYHIGTPSKGQIPVTFKRSSNR